MGGALQKVCVEAKDTYHKMIRAGVTPEQARMVLPQNTYTRMVLDWFTMYAFARVCGLRCKGDTQEETRNVAWEIHDLAKEKFPISWESLFYAAI